MVLEYGDAACRARAPVRRRGLPGVCTCTATRAAARVHLYGGCRDPRRLMG
ncbi:hypothetical protein ACFVWG_06760 [Kribbella sp. NPDC058245]|uniref:hypothetical protein n=1 Tax=Kribbella sp. NPDC058245 TaxID=3346399 RepID=UPI0036E0C885